MFELYFSINLPLSLNLQNFLRQAKIIHGNIAKIYLLFWVAHCFISISNGILDHNFFNVGDFRHILTRKLQLMSEIKL